MNSAAQTEPAAQNQPATQPVAVEVPRQSQPAATTTPIAAGPFTVVVVFIPSLSRPHFVRALPKTYSVLGQLQHAGTTIGGTTVTKPYSTFEFSRFAPVAGGVRGFYSALLAQTTDTEQQVSREKWAHSSHVIIPRHSISNCLRARTRRIYCWTYTLSVDTLRPCSKKSVLYHNTHWHEL